MLTKEEKDWLYLKRIKNQIATQLGKNEGIMTIERHPDNQILTVTIPKKGRAIMRKEEMPHINHPKLR